MTIEIRKTKEDGIIQITTLDERWYEKDSRFSPSVTWICHYSPMGLGLLKHYADKGWDEAQAIRNAAAEKGSKVHQAIEALLAGQPVTLETGFTNPETTATEDLTPDEYWAIMTFTDFWADLNKNHKVKLIDTEKVAWVEPDKGEQYGYAGTRDFKIILDGRPAIVDIKTSQSIYLTHELQLSALKHADQELPDIYLLNVGYKKNKCGWKFTQIEDKFDLFLSAKKFWRDANPDTKPKQKDYPPEIALTFQKPAYATDTKELLERQTKALEKVENKPMNQKLGERKKGDGKARRRAKASPRK